MRRDRAGRTFTVVEVRHTRLVRHSGRLCTQIVGSPDVNDAVSVWCLRFLLCVVVSKQGAAKAFKGGLTRRHPRATSSAQDTHRRPFGQRLIGVARLSHSDLMLLHDRQVRSLLSCRLGGSGFLCTRGRCCWEAFSCRAVGAYSLLVSQMRIPHQNV